MPVSSVRVTEGSGPYLHTWQRSVSSVNREEQYVQRGEPAIPTYSVVATGVSVATTSDAALQIMSGSSTYTRIHRIRVYQAALVTTAQELSLAAIRITTAGTGGTSITPRPMDTADTANATAMQGIASATTGTEGVELYRMRMYLAQGYAATGGFVNVMEWTALDRGKPIIVPSGTANGLELKILTGRAGATVDIDVEFTETAWL